MREPGFEANLRAKEQKPALSLIPTQPLMEVGRVLAYSSLGLNPKYNKDLWRKEPIEVSERVSSAMRHILAWNEGEDLDPGSGINHLAHAITQLMFTIETQRNNPEKDDRWKEKGKTANKTNKEDDPTWKSG